MNVLGVQFLPIFIIGTLMVSFITALPVAAPSGDANENDDRALR